MTFMDGLECPRCKKTYNPQKPHHLCSCSSPLLVRYHLGPVKEKAKEEILGPQSGGIWRYKKLLPVYEEKNQISLGEGGTPLLPLTKIGEELGLEQLFMKDEGRNPTGTFKARGAAVGVSKARELGLTQLCMATAGNAGGAWAAYAAQAGIKMHLAMPQDAPPITVKESLHAGAQVYFVNGLISQAGKIMAQASKKYGWFDVSTLNEPYRIEGKKTMGYEIIEQLDWRVPDAIIYPCGGGVGLIGIWKAIQEMEELGWISGKKRPRMIAVQSTGCAPIVQAFEGGKTEAVYWPKAQTIAGGIRVPAARGDFLILEALYESGGGAIAVPDDAIYEAMVQVLAQEGHFLCPEGAAGVAALPGLCQKGLLSQEDTIILLNTGTGLKYPELLKAQPPVLEVDETL